MKKTFSTNIFGQKEVLITDESYVMNNTKGEKFEITKKDIEDISC